LDGERSPECRGISISSEETSFADADSTFEDARFVIVGVPFDGTCSFRKGTKHGPKSIREESYNFETYNLDTGVDLDEVPFYDAGDLICDTLKDTQTNVENKMKELIIANKFPFFLGGEHSLTPPAVKGIGKPGVVILDAHLDFRDEYMGEHESHCCVSRRVSEIVGMENLVVIGVRSMSKQENIEAKDLGLNYFEMSKVNSIGLKNILNDINFNKIYLSLDMDAIDPSYAPGVGNPEFFGLSPTDIYSCIHALKDRLIGMDITEVNPAYDKGNTSSLAARIVRDVIAEIWSLKK
jgi:agmatinase